jgi:hypothetical protein
LLNTPSVPVKSRAAKNDVAIFIVLTSFHCVMTTGSAKLIPSEPTSLST